MRLIDSLLSLISVSPAGCDRPFAGLAARLASARRTAAVMVRLAGLAIDVLSTSAEAASDVFTTS